MSSYTAEEVAEIKAQWKVQKLESDIRASRERIRRIENDIAVKRAALGRINRRIFDKKLKAIK